MSKVAYRTDLPEILSIHAEWVAAMNEHHARLMEFKRAHDPEDVLVMRVWEHRRFAYFEDGDAPDGWRRGKGGRIVPDKRLKTGKQIAANIKALDDAAPQSLRSLLTGMPDHAFIGSRLLSPGVFVHDGAVYVHWDDRPEEVDKAIWTEIKQSELYAAMESYEEARERVAA